VAAINQEQFDGSGGTWCGGACGICYKLTATGMYLNGRLLSSTYMDIASVCSVK